MTNVGSVLVLFATLLVSFRAADALVSYVRWGRTVCPTGSVRLYKGYMAGAYYGAKGSGSNYLCIHEEPKFVRAKAGRQDWQGMIFGVEFDYRAENFGIFKTDNIPGGTLINQNMPCAVCYVADSSDKLLIPGRPDCGSTGYDLQYSGFMVSEYSGDRGRSEYVCLDETPEGTPGGAGDNNEGIIYPVEIGCGTLPCNPFVDGYELPCALCTY